jgi:capsular polysaccharide export protein
MAAKNGVRIGWPFRKLKEHPLLEGVIRALGLNHESVHLGWGLRPSGRAAIRAAEQDGGRLLLLEDAFVRSIRPGKSGAIYGVLADSKGMHYDIHGSSDLLDALESGKPQGWMHSAPPDPDATARTMRRFREIGASKYNWFPGEYRPSPPPSSGILVVDQTRGDMSIRCGGMAGKDFDRMLRAALDEFDNAPVYLRAHPDHLFRAKSTCISKKLLADPRVRLLSPDLSPAQCFSFCHTVMVGSSLMGLEALIHGCRVITYGLPFYAGRGLTEDRSAVKFPRERRPLGLDRLFEMAYLRQCHYFDPDTRETCGLDTILDHLELQKEMFRKNRGTSVTVGFSPWARSIVPNYLRSPAGELIQVKEMSEALPDARLLVWGRRPTIPEAFHGRCARVEDGFIRSKGLGAAFNFPYSWVVDFRGIYFDPTAPSDLEEILNHGFSAADLQESAQLIELLREKRLTKYNLTTRGISLDPAKTRGKKIILVPGQVEADASIAFGSPVLKSNIELLQAVRNAEPSAFLIFKAHPDLVAGARHGKVLPPGYDGLSDLAVTDGNVLDWLDLCDEVHTMTSTVGFEALIRNVPVVTYGIPFYAAWGLTTDRLECPRRTRKLTLEELVCGALIQYPRYLNPATGEFTTALKVARLLTSDGAAGDERAWHLKTVSKLKKLWVELAR